MSFHEITFIRACSMTRANPVNIYRIIQNVPHIFANPGKSGSTSHMFCIIKYKGCLYTVPGGGGGALHGFAQP